VLGGLRGVVLVCDIYVHGLGGAGEAQRVGASRVGMWLARGTRRGSWDRERGEGILWTRETGMEMWMVDSMERSWVDVC
jgi:hypothetical protein